jgi:large subunit ribosomal protein L32
MAVPKRRQSKMRRDKRRANHDKVLPPNLISCPSCDEKIPRHIACPACGDFKGTQYDKLMKTSS